ncbi:MAG: SIS domain-containing protein [Candidatus Promineifilaceae bacterium]
MKPLNSTFLFQEIHEQPVAIGRFFANETDNIARLATAMQARGVDHVVIAARGTSDNAGRYAQYVLGAINGLQVALATPSLFSLYQRPISFGNALVLGISQSGQSPDIVSVLRAARQQGKLTAAITNTPASPLAEVADFVINLHAGHEQAVAATKTYTSSLAAIALLSAMLAGDGGLSAELQQLPAAIAQTLSLNDTLAALAPRYRYMQHCVVIGRGYNYATAFEMALKMKELSYSIVEPYSSADFQHGPFAILNEGFPVFVIAPAGALRAEIEGFVERVGGRSAETIVISDVDSLLQKDSIPIQLPTSLPEWLSPFTAIITGQLFAMHLAHTRGYNVDSPRAIHKVTETN